jgi:phage shock protein E
MSGIRMFLLICGLLALSWQCRRNADLPTGPGTPLPEGCLSVSTQRARELMDKMPRLLVLDARTPAEFHTAHLPGAISLDVTDEAHFQRQLRNLDRSQPCLVYCQNGTRSRKACALLREEGFRQVYHLEGGYRQWPRPD